MRYLRAIAAFLTVLALFTAPVAAAGKYINMKLEYDGSVHNYSAEEVSLVVDGKALKELPMPPILFDDYTLVPAREVFEALGADVKWISDLYQVYITCGDDVVMLEIDSKKAYVNGDTLTMSIAPKIINDKTMIPLRFVSESIGMEVGWDSKTRVASISKPAVQTTAATTAAPVTTTVQTTTEATTEATTSALQIPRFGTSDSLNAYTSDEYAKTKITSLSKATDSESMFIVNAEGEISSVKVTSISSNTVAVDIENADNAINAAAYNVDDSRVKNVEISQQSGTSPSVRLLFNMKSQGDFKLYLSSNRKRLGISVGTNEISKIELTKLIGGDRLVIQGKSAPSVKTVTSVTGDLLTIDVMDAVLDTDNGKIGEGRVVDGGTYHQLNANTVRISLDLKEKAGCAADVRDNTVILTIATGIESNSVNTSVGSSGGSIRYESQTGLIIPGAAGTVNPSAILHSDNYNDLNYVLTLPVNLSQFISESSISVNENGIKDITVTASGSQTVIKLNESRIMAVNVTSSGGDLIIKPVMPKEKYSKIVVLDAGHGGDDVGTGYNNEIYEKDLTLAMLNKTKALFDASDIKCYATRTTDVYPTFDDRTELADEGDIFVSIHINSAGTSNTSASGTETYCQYPNNPGNGLTSYIVAERVLNKLLEKLGTVNRKVKTEDFRVLRESHVPATLAEIGFITNASDRAMMASEDGQNKVAQAIYEAVTELFDEYPAVR